MKRGHLRLASTHREASTWPSPRHGVTRAGTLLAWRCRLRRLVATLVSAMPVLLAWDTQGALNQTVRIVFPKRTADNADGGWQWDEVAVCSSSIEGFGLEVRHTANLDWTRCKDSPVYVPLLGRETELSSGVEASIFARVLQGSFVAFPFEEMMTPPAGYKWASDGPYLELVREEDEMLADSQEEPAADEIVLQVLLNHDTNVGDQSCIYLLKRAAMQLLHMPAHVFAVLAAHHRHHHVDRHFATHVASYTRGPRSHVPIRGSHNACILPCACIQWAHGGVHYVCYRCSSTRTPYFATQPLPRAASTSRTLVRHHRWRCDARVSVPNPRGNSTIPRPLRRGRTL